MTDGNFWCENAWLDGEVVASVAVVVDAIRDAAEHYARDGHVTMDFEAESITPIVEFPDDPRLRVQAALSRFGEVPVLPTAAGHDAGILSAKVPTAMLFVRNPTGVSHAPEEFAEQSDVDEGVKALAATLEHLGS